MKCEKCPASLNVCEGGEKGDWFCTEFLKKLALYIAENENLCNSCGQPLTGCTNSNCDATIN